MSLDGFLQEMSELTQSAQYWEGVQDSVAWQDNASAFRLWVMMYGTAEE
jgi:hypothetical protein